MKRYGMLYKARPKSKARVFWTRAESIEIALGNFKSFVYDMQDKGRFPPCLHAVYEMRQM